MEKLLTMSANELSRLDVMKRLEEKRLKQKEAAEMLSVSVRQIKRLLSQYRQDDASGLVCQQRGKVSNHRLSQVVQEKVLDLLKGKYLGFGPTLACEKMVQIDGSSHVWFEERGAGCTLLVAIDDATGKLVGLLFAEHESFHSYACLAKAYFERYGKPVAFYSDKHGIFRVNHSLV